MTSLITKKVKKLNGTITIPSDKSITHRALMMLAMTKGYSACIENISLGKDCLATLDIIQKLGCDVKFINANNIIITSPKKFVSFNKTLDCKNSGTSMRLFAGLLGSLGMELTLIGDQSLSKRPMQRIIYPLSLMGVNFQHNNFKAPLHICSNIQNLQHIQYVSELPSAQVKSSILLCSLNIDKSKSTKTIFSEPFLSRNHTEKMLQYLQADIEFDDNKIITKYSQLTPKNISVCGDISSAAFFLCAATIVPNSSIIIKNVNLNPTRTGIIDVLTKMQANISILNEHIVCNEEVGDICVQYTENLKPINIQGQDIPRLIDELPVICVLASQANGITTIKDAQDLKYKETDRILATVSELSKLGIKIKARDDGFEIEGKSTIKGDCTVQSFHDHRIAMSLYVASLISEKTFKINDFQWVDISFPSFLQLFNSIIVQ